MDSEYRRFEIEYSDVEIIGELEEGELMASTVSEQQVHSILKGETQKLEDIADEIYNLAQKRGETSQNTHTDGEITFYGEEKESYGFNESMVQHMPFDIEIYLKSL